MGLLSGVLAPALTPVTAARTRPAMISRPGADHDHVPLPREARQRGYAATSPEFEQTGAFLAPPAATGRLRASAAFGRYEARLFLEQTAAMQRRHESSRCQTPPGRIDWRAQMAWATQRD
jgi:hypothetical protein